MRALFIVVSTVAIAACGGSGRCDHESFGAPFCVPDAGVAPAGQKLTLEVIDVCHAGCGSSDLSCTVSRDGGVISLTLEGQICRPAPNVVCNALCAMTRHSCEVSGLPEGDYVVKSESQPDRALHVGDAGVSSCTASLF